MRNDRGGLKLRHIHEALRLDFGPDTCPERRHPSSSRCAFTCAPSTVPVRWASRWQEVAAVVAAQSSHLALTQALAPLWDWPEGLEQCEGSCPITGVWRAFTPPTVRLAHIWTSNVISSVCFAGRFELDVT